MVAEWLWEKSFLLPKREAWEETHQSSMFYLSILYLLLIPGSGADESLHGLRS